MTRVLAFGDLHLDAGTSHREDALADHELALELIDDLVRDLEIDLVLFAGDAFHRPHASDRARHILRRFLRRLRQRDVAFVGVLGNASHDQYGTDRETALELEHDGEHVWVSRHPEVVVAAGVAVCTLPNVPVSRLVATAGGGDRSRIYREAADALITVARGLHEQATGPTVLLGHWSVSGTSLPNGLPVDDLHEPVLDAARLAALGFDWLVFGHIHAPCSEPVIYTGSPMCLDFGEANVPHGVWCFDTGDDDEPSFMQLADRRFVTVDVDLVTDEAFALAQTGEFDETAAIIDAIPLPLDGAVVRVRYRAAEAQHRRVDQAAIRTLVTDAGGRLFQIAPEIVSASRARAEHVTETLEPLDAVAAWCAANSITGDHAGALADLTRELLAGSPA